MSTEPTTLADCCTTGVLHKGTPTGAVSTVAGLPCYVAGDKGDRVVIMLTDVFGWELNNTRLVADAYAQRGFYVLLPDLFEGDALPADLEHKLAPPESAPKRGILQVVTDTFSAVGQGAPWMYRHRQAVSLPIINKFVSTLRSEMPTAKLGAVGFCWGGRYSVLLTHADAEVQVDCAVACHPSGLSVPSDIQKMTKPVSVQVGEKDFLFTVKQANQTRDIIEKKGIPGEVTTYPGAVHGFAVRGDLSVPETKKQQEACTAATCAWLDKYLAPAKSTL